MTTPALLCLVTLLGANAPQTQPKLALLPFRVLRMPADLAPALDAHLAGAVDACGKYDLVTTQDINAMLGLERMKDAVSCTDTACAADIGGALGADFMLSPQATALGDMVEITIILIDVRHANVIGRKQGRVPRDEKFLAKGIDEAVEHLIGPIPSAPSATADTMPVLFTTDKGGGYEVEADVQSVNAKFVCDGMVTNGHACTLNVPHGDVDVLGRYSGSGTRAVARLRLSYNAEGYTVNMRGDGSVAKMVFGGLGIGLGVCTMLASTIAFVVGGESAGFPTLGVGVALTALGGWSLAVGIPTDSSTVTPGVAKAELKLSRAWNF